MTNEITYSSTAAAESTLIEKLRDSGYVDEWLAATRHEQVACGIDGYFNGVPIDIKHTKVVNDELPFEVDVTTRDGEVKDSWFISVNSEAQAYIYCDTETNRVYWVDRRMLRELLNAYPAYIRHHTSRLSAYRRSMQAEAGHYHVDATILYVNISDMEFHGVATELTCV